MITPEKIAALEAAASSWLGTPFCEGSPVKGSGVSCHHLVAQIDFECGYARFDVPNGIPGWASSQSRSPIAEYLDASPDFEAIMVREGMTLDLQPYDHLGFRLRLSIHHIGLILAGNRMVHCIQRHGVQIAPCVPDPWLRRLERVWRPKWV